MGSDPICLLGRGGFALDGADDLAGHEEAVSRGGADVVVGLIVGYEDAAVVAVGDAGPDVVMAAAADEGVVNVALWGTRG